MRVDGMDVEARDRVVRQEAHQSVGAQGAADDEGRLQHDALPGHGRRHHGIAIVGDEVARDRDRLGAEAPLVAVGRVAVEQAIVLGEVGRPPRHAVALEVAGRGAQDEPAWGQPARDQARIGQTADAVARS